MTDYKKSKMMDYVLDNLKDIISSLVINKQYVANRTETLKMTQDADNYIAAKLDMSDFYSYHIFSEYALIKAGLSDKINQYQYDKTTIPRDKRDDVVRYEKEYILVSYVERNDYYRMLNGEPNIGEASLYLDKDYPNIDITKPIHKMNEDEISILEANGVLNILREKYPDKKYLNHLSEETRIPYHISRRAKDFDILYINRDRTKYGVPDMFLGIYRQVRNYVIDKFKDDAYKYQSPYYDAFIGLFILCITVQRFITNFFNRFINRDFYDKDLIGLLFESYGLPIYNEIPLNYLQTTAKNLNKLLYYKATDKVFVDIFKIFNLDNIDIKNYYLFKDRKMDDKGLPIVAYKEKTQLEYFVDTVVNEYSYKDNNELEIYNYGRLLYNVKSTVDLYNKDNRVTLFLCHDGSLYISSTLVQYGHNVLYKESRISNGVLMDKLYSSDGNIAIIYDEEPYIFYIYDINHTIYTKVTIPEKYNDECITNVFARSDRSNDKCIFIINTKTKGYLFYSDYVGYDNHTNKNIKNTSNFTLLYTADFPITYLTMEDDAIVFVDSNNQVYVKGRNTNSRLYIDRKNCTSTTDPHVETFTSLKDKIGNVSKVYIFKDGCAFVMSDGTLRYTGLIPELDLTESLIAETDKVTDLTSVQNIQFINDGTKFFYIVKYFNNSIDVFNYKYTDKLGKLLFGSNTSNNHTNLLFVKDFAETERGFITVNYNVDSNIYYIGENSNNIYPFIKTKTLAKLNNDSNIKEVELTSHGLYFVDNYNKIYKSVRTLVDGKYTSKNEEIPLYFVNQFVYDSEYTKVQEEIMKFKKIDDTIYILVGKSYYYILNKYGYIECFNDTTFTEIIVDVYVINGIKYIETLEGKYYKVTSVKNLYVDGLLYKEIDANSTLDSDFHNDYMNYFNGDTLPIDANLEDKDFPMFIDANREYFVNKIQFSEYTEVYFLPIIFKNDNNDLYLKETEDANKEDNTYLHELYYTKINNKNDFSSTSITITGIDGKIKLIYVVNDTIILDGEHVYYIKLDDLVAKENTHTIKATLFEDLDKIKFKSELINNEYIMYNKFGGITIFNNSSLIKTLQLIKGVNTEIEGYISVFNSNQNVIKDIDYTDNDFIMIGFVNTASNLEYDYRQMFDLKFITSTYSSDKLAETFIDSDNYLDYGLTVEDDSLWGGDGDQSEYINSLLESEFNYIETKYIGVDSKYSITNLNMEVCYMFKMLIELKEYEELFNFYVPYVGDVQLFDAIVALFDLVCFKFEFDGNIMDSITKSLSVLGFNFDRDLSYVYALMDQTKWAKYCMFSDTDEICDTELVMPKHYTKSAEEINMFLDNKETLEALYTKMWNTKDIEEYNIYKSLLYATFCSKRTKDVYEVNGVVPSTYREYLRAVNPKLAIYLDGVNRENMTDMMDNILVSINNFINSDKFKYLFLNIPSLSLENIRKYIYYLIEIFKSYTVDLKSMNIIYDIDDKRISNIKLLFKSYFTKYHYPNENTLDLSSMQSFRDEFELILKILLKQTTKFNSSFEIDNILRISLEASTNKYLFFKTCLTQLLDSVEISSKLSTSTKIRMWDTLDYIKYSNTNTDSKNCTEDYLKIKDSFEDILDNIINEDFNMTDAISMNEFMQHDDNKIKISDQLTFIRKE